MASARMLLEKHATIGIENMYGHSPFYLACWQGHFETALLLASKGANIDEVSRKSQIAALSFINDEDKVRLLRAASVRS